VSDDLSPGGGAAAPGDTAEAWTPSEHERARRAARRSQNTRRILVAVVSSVVVIGGLVAIVVTSKGWPVVQETFFDVAYGLEVLPAVFEGFVLNVQLLVVCSITIAVLSLLLALARTSRAAALTPFRLFGFVCGRRAPMRGSGSWRTGKARHHRRNRAAQRASPIPA